MGFKKHKGNNGTSRLTTGPFVMLTHEVLCSANFASLKPSSVKLFCALLAQLRPIKGDPAPNNGDLCVAPAVLKQYGLTNQHTITTAKNELVEKGWLEMTKLGGLHMGPTLYAFSMWAIGDCKGKLDAQPTRTPSHAWRTSPFNAPPTAAGKKRPCETSISGK